MTLRRFEVYDSLSRRERLFVPRNPPRVGMYVCGLTPYAESHIGHGRTAVTFDVVGRALRRWGYRLFHVESVTNLDDHVIDRAGETGTGPLELSERMFRAHQRALTDLRVRSVDLYAFATDYLPEILEQIQQLVDGGFAYPAAGSVYYEVAKFPRYGQLSGQRLDEQRPGTRVAVEPGKRTPEDFVLWKASRPGEPSWESTWGPGRPGWHIEDTAITTRLLGAQYDLHGGGLELKFPHHEAEIAQAEAATGRTPLVNYWMHAGLLNLRGEKMAKSLGNVVGLSETIEKFGADTLRFFYLNAVYRSPLEFVAGESLEQAGVALDRLRQPLELLREELATGAERVGEELPTEIAKEAADLPERMEDSLAHDFNSRETIAQLFGWAHRVSELRPQLGKLSGDSLQALLGPFEWASEALGIFEPSSTSVPVDLGPLVEVALAARERARSRGDFSEADRIREELGQAGIRVEDGAGTTRWRRQDGVPVP